MRNQIKHIKEIHCLAFLTYRCSSQCKTCNIWKRNTDQHEEMKWEQWKDILIRLKNFGIKSLEIFGGDALLRKDIIFKIIRFCKDNRIETFFPTNSLLLDFETAKGLVEAGLGTIYFSLDDVDVNSDLIRGVEESFGKVKMAMENLLKARGDSASPRIIVCTTISNLNYNHFERVVDFLKNYPIDAIYPRALAEFSQQNIEDSKIDGIYPLPYFVSSEEKSHLLGPEQINQFRETVIKLKKNKNEKQPYINFISIDTTTDSAFTTGEYSFKHCQICKILITITPNGDIVPCPFYCNYIIGNLYKEESLDKIFGNEKHIKFVKFQQEKKLSVCKNCIMPAFYQTSSEKIRYHLRRLKEKVGFY